MSDRWSECSRTCGGGVRKSVRECDNPTPLNGGLYCTGDRLRYESCHTQDCHQASDLRLEQCRAYNGNNFNIDDLPAWVEWVPKYTDSKQRLFLLGNFLILLFSWRERQMQTILPCGVLQCLLPPGQFCHGWHCLWY